MFFSISRQIDPRFDYCYSVPGWKINVDQGWHSQQTQRQLVLFKGYCDQFSMQHLIDMWPTTHHLTGNFCVITAGIDGVRISHSQPRPFPLWYGQDTITNFAEGKHLLACVWADASVYINSAGEFCFEKNSTLDWTLRPLTTDQVVQQTVDLLITHATQFKKHHPVPINIYRTGGVDTALIQALCNNVGIPNVLIDQTVTPTGFMAKNKSTLDQFWAYQQLHFWEYDSCIATGSHGDEYFLRGPDDIALITAWHNIDFLSLLERNPECYHYHYFNRDVNRNKFQSQYDQRSQLKVLYPTWNDLCLQILNMLSNDHQHWHLGKTMTWTPLKEITVAQWCLNLPIDELIDNFLNATITKKCIEKLDISLLESINFFKNHKLSGNNKFCSI